MGIGPLKVPLRLSQLPLLTPRDLACMIAVADHGSLIAASAYPHTSQSALSRTITRAERLLGVTLFTRTTRRISITAAGREFLAVAERMLNDMQLALANMREVASERRGQVIISTFPVFAQYTLPQMVRAFRDTRPHVEVHLRTGRNPEVIEDVYSGRADFGVTYADFLPPSIDPLPLGDERLYAVVPRDHRLARSRKPLRFGLLKDVTTIALSRESLTRRLVDGAAAASGFGLSNEVVVPGFLEMIGLARCGVGVGIVPESVVPLARAQTAVRRIVEPDLAVSMVVITLRGRQLTPVAAGLRALIIECVRASHRRRPRL